MKFIWVVDVVSRDLEYFSTIDAALVYIEENMREYCGRINLEQRSVRG